MNKAVCITAMPDGSASSRAPVLLLTREVSPMRTPVIRQGHALDDADEPDQILRR